MNGMNNALIRHHVNLLLILMCVAIFEDVNGISIHRNALMIVMRTIQRVIAYNHIVFGMGSVQCIHVWMLTLRMNVMSYSYVIGEVHVN